VTVEVGPLDRQAVRTALDAGFAAARHMVGGGLITQAVLRLGDEIVTTAHEGAPSDA